MIVRSNDGCLFRVTDYNDVAFNGVRVKLVKGEFVNVEKKPRLVRKACCVVVQEAA